MSQIEDPANLDRWTDPGRRLITLILIRCGLRVGDACRLPSDCIVADGGGQPYLRYYDHKMKREALVPVDDEIVAEIGRQRQRNTARQPGGTPVLFPRPTKNIDGSGPGAKGHRYYDRALISLGNDRPGFRHLLDRRGELPGRQTLTGLDERQVRTWTSWHRWTTLALLASAALTLAASAERASPVPPDQIPLTRNEIARLMNALIIRPTPDPASCLHWSRWRRRHQHRLALCQSDCRSVCRSDCLACCGARVCNEGVMRARTLIT